MTVGNVKKYSALEQLAQSAATGAGLAAFSGGVCSDLNDRAIQANARAAITSMARPTPTSPKITFPIPNNDPYTPTIPASQLVHANAPPGIGSRPRPRRSDTPAQPGPPGRTRM